MNFINVTQKRFPMVRLREVAQPIERAETPIIRNIYRQVGVKLWGIGAYEREPIEGSQTKYKTLSRVEADDIVVNKIWARNGSVAVIPKNLAGCYVSSEFPTFVPIREKLNPRWFHWLTKTKNFWKQCDDKSQGTSGKNRIRPERFLEIEIPLPPLPEQNRIVVRIEKLVAEIDKAHRLRQQTVEESESLFKSARLKSLSDALDKYGGESLGSLISMSSGEGLTSNQLDDSYEYPVYGGGGFVGRYSRYLFEETKIVIGRVGARCGCIFVTEPKSWVTDNALYLKKISDRLDMKYLVHALSNVDLRQQANQAAQPVISQKKINPVIVPVPPLSEQRRIVAYLDNLQSKIDELKRLQVATEAELDALMPSILDKAFKGEL